jgi:hypothetical protein
MQNYITAHFAESVQIKSEWKVGNAMGVVQKKRRDYQHLREYITMKIVEGYIPFNSSQKIIITMEKRIFQGTDV